jgi:porin
VLLAPNYAKAQLVEVPPTWGGDIFSRPRLTGDWGGVRDELGQEGIVFDADLLMTPQIVTSGGRSSGGSLWGNLDYTLNVDTQKLGLWPGGFFKFSADTGFGSNAFGDAGTIVPVNTAALIPAPDDKEAAGVGPQRYVMQRRVYPRWIVACGRGSPRYACLSAAATGVC